MLLEVINIVLDKVKKHLQAASNTIDLTQTRTNAMERQLRKVELPPEAGSIKLLEEEAGQATEPEPDNEENDTTPG